MAKGSGGTIVIKREEGGEAGHHGGAWKVAYADFVTAMMAFFLLMWLLNATSEEQRRGLADYFSPTNMLARSASGSGQPFGGKTPHEVEEMASNSGTVRAQTGPIPIVTDLEDDDSETRAQPTPMREAPVGQDDADPQKVQAPPPSPGQEAVDPATAARLSEQALRAELAQREQQQMDQLADQIRQTVAQDPALSDLAKQLMVEQVPEGLRIQLLDADRQPMFALGGSAPNDKSRALIAKVAQLVNRMPNQIAVTGHTDATPFRSGDRSNWDLSADRANVTRRLLTEGGVAEPRIRSVAGLAARELLLPDAPTNASNRRVSILMLRDNPPPVGPLGSTTR